jgi:hypothetical protein
MVRQILLMMVLLLPISARAMEVLDIQGACEPTSARKLVRQNSVKLERCGATGGVMLHVSAQGRVEHVSADPDARNCLQARTADWHVQMKEANHCTLHLATDAGLKQTHANVEASTHAHPAVGVTATTLQQPAPTAEKAAKPGRLSKAAKKAAKAAALAGKKAAKAAAIAAKKAAKAAGIAAKKSGKAAAGAAKKSKAAAAKAARTLKAQTARAAKAQKAKQKREAMKEKAAEKKAAKHAKLKPNKKKHARKAKTP